MIVGIVVTAVLAAAAWAWLIMWVINKWGNYDETSSVTEPAEQPETEQP